MPVGCRAPDEAGVECCLSEQVTKSCIPKPWLEGEGPGDHLVSPFHIMMSQLKHRETQNVSPRLLPGVVFGTAITLILGSQCLRFKFQVDFEFQLPIHIHPIQVITQGLGPPYLHRKSRLNSGFPVWPLPSHGCCCRHLGSEAADRIFTFQIKNK